MRESNRIFIPFWLSVALQFCLLVSYINADTRVTRGEGESIKVHCPKLTQGELRAMSFYKQGKTTPYTTLFSKIGNNKMRKTEGSGSVVSLDEAKRVMTVSKLSMKDNDITFTCKLVSHRQEVTKGVTVTILVPPKLTISMTPKAPYRNNTSVTVLCEVAKVNPPLKDNQISLRIGNDVYNITRVRQNVDMTWRYTTMRSYYVTRARDDRKLVSCATRTSGIVRKYKQTARLQFIRPPKGTPHLSASNTVIRKGDELILRCILKDTGIPPTNTYLFYQNGRLVKRNGHYSKLTVRITSSINAGSYSCKVANSEGASSFSNSVCIAFTTEQLPGKGIPIWLSVTSILLNIAALAYICVFYVKPRVLKFVDDFRSRSKTLPCNKEGKLLNKEEKQNSEKEKVPKGVKVIYDDNTPYDNSEKRKLARLGKPDHSDDKKANSEAIDDVVPDPLPEQSFLKDPRAPHVLPTSTQAYEDLSL